MNKNRIVSVQDRMAAEGVDLSIFGCGSSYQYLTGIDDGWRFRADMVSPSELLVVPAAPGRPGAPNGSATPLDVEPVLLSRASDLADQLRQIAADSLGSAAGRPDAGGRPGTGALTIAVGDQPKPDAWRGILAAFPDATFVEGDALVAPVRMIKEPGEIETLRRAAAITDESVRAALSSIREGITMRELQLEIEFQGRRRGAVGTSFDIVSGFIQPGKGSTGSIFSYEPDEGLRAGTTIFFDIGFVVDGYCSDWGRTVYFGSPSDRYVAAYASLQRAVVETVAAMEVGKTRVCDIFPMIEERLDSDGFGEYIRARLPSKSVGHQIGIEVHELPWLKPQNSEPIVPGMVFCMEPKLWEDGEFYMRVEDMVQITESGAEFLTTFDRELFVL